MLNQQIDINVKRLSRNGQLKMHKISLLALKEDANR